MKPFLGIDLTADKHNEQANGREFLAAAPSPALAQSLERSSDRALETLEAAKLPMALRVIQWICGGAALLIGVSIIRALAKVSIQQAYQNAAVLFWIVGICLPVWLVLNLLGKRKANTVLGQDDSAAVLSNLEGIRRSIYQELNVPADAPETDLLSFYYKEKNGDIRPTEKGMQMATYLNPVFRIYADEKYLYIANLEGKYAFPLSDIVGIRTIRKHIRICGWNKDAPYNKGIYKSCKLTKDNYGCIHCKQYHILEVRRDGEVWGIWIPDYELPVFEGLTRHRAL